MSKLKKKMKNQPQFKTMTKTIVKKHKNKAVIGKKACTQETLKKKEKLGKKSVKLKKLGKEKEAVTNNKLKRLKGKKTKKKPLKEMYEKAETLSFLLDTNGNLSQEEIQVDETMIKVEENTPENGIIMNTEKDMNIIVKDSEVSREHQKVNYTEAAAEKNSDVTPVLKMNSKDVGAVVENSAAELKKKNKAGKKMAKVSTTSMDKKIKDAKKKKKIKTIVAGELIKKKKNYKSKQIGRPKDKTTLPKRKRSRKDRSKYKMLKEKERELAMDLFGFDEGVVHVAKEKAVDSVFTESVPARDVAQKKRKLSENEEEQILEVEEADKVEPKRKAVWVDEDDENIRVMDVVANMTKARGTRGERETSTKKYEVELRDKLYQVYGGTPDWADLDHRPEEDSDDEDELTRSTGNYLSKESSISLPRRRLEYKPMEDLNSSHTEGAFIQAIDFNPHLQVGLVAGSQKHVGAATLYQVDGKVNHRIHSVRFPDYYLTCARFMREGKKFVVGSTQSPHFYVYDMEASKETKIVWKKKIDRVVKEHVFVSPDGELLIFLGHSGKICLYDTATLSLVDTMQSPHIVTSASFNSDGSRMYTFGTTGDVCIWDMHARECVHKFYDDGCVTGSAISMSPNNQYLACGSRSGVVNVYDSASLTSTTAPKPAKVLLNLTTPVTALSFNSSSEVLAMASNRLPNAVKLVHFPSMTVFENFPYPGKTMKPVGSLQFSPQSGYLAVGNQAGAAQLFRLKHYKSY